MGKTSAGRDEDTEVSSLEYVTKVEERDSQLGDNVAEEVVGTL